VKPAVQSVTDGGPDPDQQDRADAMRLAGGDDAALNDLMDRHGGKLMNYLVRCLQDEGLAADLTQETFVRVYQHRNKFDARQKFSTWLYAIASNLLRDHFRWKSRHPEAAPDALEKASTEISPSEIIQTGERAEAVRAAIALLPEELRLPLILTEYENRSQAEVGEILGCSAKAVETRIYRARKILRVKLHKWIAD
jgi:RNA polymerase sigma factor (sigma-70 family)